MSKRKAKPISPTAPDEPAAEYNFSNAERGRFHKPGLRLVPPVHLDPKVLDVLQTRARQRGVSVSDLVNELLQRQIELADVVK